jgi:hypothetical protein
MSAAVLRFPALGPFAVRVEHEVDGEGWMVIARNNGWLHANRDAALADAHWVADGFGVSVGSSA